MGNSEKGKLHTPTPATLAAVDEAQMDLTSPGKLPDPPVSRADAEITQNSQVDDKVVDKLTRKPPEKYKFRRSIGQGGMKTVLQVKDRDSMRDIAMAVLPDAQNRPKTDIIRFIQEARITASLEHPNIVPVHDIGVDASGAPYFTMKLLQGETLASLLKKLEAGDPDYLAIYDLDRLLHLFLKICNGVGFAHSKGVLHLDLKPENIQVGDYGEVLILDWGLAKIVGNPDRLEDDEDDDEPSLKSLSDYSITIDGVMKGTPGYMAPEQAAGKNRDRDYRTDVYALGAILYALVTYKDPIENKDVKEMVRDTIDGRIVPPKLRSPEKLIPSAIEAVIKKAMAVNPDDRYSTAREVRDEVYAFIGGYATMAERATPLKKAMLFAKRHKIILSSLAIILFLSASFGSYALYELSRQRSDWTLIFSEDFTKGDPSISDIQFFNSNLSEPAQPWKCDQDGLKMVRGEWLWPKSVKVNEDVKVVAKVLCAENPDALEVCLNSRIEPLKEWWHVPAGYSFQFAGFGGSKDIIFKNEDAFAPDVLMAIESKFEVSKPHTVVFRREDEKLSMTIDGEETLQASDIFRPIGPHLDKVGVRTFSNSMKLQSLSVYRLSLPEKASPIIAGDVLVETQHFEEAIDKYLTIADNYGKTPLAELALTKAYIAAASKLKNPVDRNRLLIDVKKLIANRFPSFKYRERIVEVDSLMYWRERQYKEALSLLPELFELNPNTNAVSKLLQFQHQRLPKEVITELFSWIQKTPNMKRLNISNLGVESVKPLAGLPLIYLDCSSNDISSLEGLEGMRLEVLSCQTNKIADLEPLRDMPLKNLNCQENLIKDISPLEKMPLKDLNCNWNKLISLDPLKGMTLERLSFSGNQVDSLEALRGMPLKMLDCSKTNVTSLDPIKGMALEMLNCSGTQVKSIAPIEGMPLMIADLHDCQNLQDVGPLFSMSSLERLSIPEHVRDIAMLRALPNLKFLSNKSASLFSTQQETAEEFWIKYDAERKDSQRAKAQDAK